MYGLLITIVIVGACLYAGIRAEFTIKFNMTVEHISPAYEPVEEDTKEPEDDGGTDNPVYSLDKVVGAINEAFMDIGGDTDG